jgi:cell division protein FtsB
MASRRLAQTWIAGVPHMRVLIIVLSVILVLLQYRLWLSDDGRRAVRALEEAVIEQRRENAELAERNERLAAEVADLKEGLEAVEEIARTDLGMIGPGETLYQIASPVEQPAPDGQ